MAGEHDTARLMADMGRALLEASSSPSFMAGSQHVTVDADGWLHVPGWEEPISFERLRRTIANAARNLKVASGWLQTMPEDEEERRRGRAATANYVVRTHRSMEALARLLNTSELISPFQDTLHPEEEMTGQSREDLSGEEPGEWTKKVQLPDPAVGMNPTDPVLKLAEVHRRIKNGVVNMSNVERPQVEDWESMKSYLLDIMTYISSGEHNG